MINAAIVALLIFLVTFLIFTHNRREISRIPTTEKLELEEARGGFYYYQVPHRYIVEFMKLYSAYKGTSDKQEKYNLWYFIEHTLLTTHNVNDRQILHSNISFIDATIVIISNDPHLDCNTYFNIEDKVIGKEEVLTEELEKPKNEGSRHHKSINMRG